MNRRITRVVTPGTVTDDSLLPANGEASLLLAVGTDEKGGWRLLWCDVSTGQGGSRQCESAAEGLALIGSLQPREVLVVPSLAALSPEITRTAGTSCRVVASSEVSVEGAIVAHLRASLAPQPHLPTMSSLRALQADAGTRDALDLVRSSAGSSRAQSVVGSVLHVFHSSGYAFTSPAQRLLRSRLLHPLHPDERATIEARLQRIQWLLTREEVVKALKLQLRAASLYGDPERAMQRISLGLHRSMLHLSRDLRSVASAVALASGLSSGSAIACWPDLSKAAPASLVHEWALDALQLVVPGPGEDDIGACGVRSGIDAELDGLNDLGQISEEIAAAEQRLSAVAGVPLKVSRKGWPNGVTSPSLCAMNSLVFITNAFARNFEHSFTQHHAMLTTAISGDQGYEERQR